MATVRGLRRRHAPIRLAFLLDAFHELQGKFSVKSSLTLALKG